MWKFRIYFLKNERKRKVIRIWSKEWFRIEAIRSLHSKRINRMKIRFSRHRMTTMQNFVSEDKDDSKMSYPNPVRRMPKSDNVKRIFHFDVARVINEATKMEISSQNCRSVETTEWAERNARATRHDNIIEKSSFSIIISMVVRWHTVEWVRDRMKTRVVCRSSVNKKKLSSMLVERLPFFATVDIIQWQFRLLSFLSQFCVRSNEAPSAIEKE